MSLRLLCWTLVLVTALSGCTSISSTSSLDRRPSGQVSNFHVRYIQNSFRATNRLMPGIAYSPVALLERDGYYDLGNELRVIAPEVASERGVQVDVSVSDTHTLRNDLNGSVGVNQTASQSEEKELVLFMESGQLPQGSGSADAVFHVIFRDLPPGIEYWHADYRVKVNNIAPGEPAFDGETVTKLVSRIFDDLEKDGLIVSIPQQSGTELAQQPASTRPQPVAPAEKIAIAPGRVPYIDARGQDGFRKWLAGGMHRAFAISTDGHWGYSADAPAVSGDTQAAEQRALSICQILAKTECFIFALDNKVVWPGPGAGASPSASADH